MGIEPNYRQVLKAIDTTLRLTAGRSYQRATPAYTKKRASIGMNVRSIQPDIKPAKEYKKRDKNELRVTKLIPNKKFPAECELNIIGDMIAIFSSHGEESTGMKLYNKDIARTLKSLFELGWERAGEYDKI